MVQIRIYTMTTKADRVVAFDSVFTCPNPSCRYTSPFRSWGRGHAENKVEKRHIMPTIPGTMRLATKQAAERMAWEDAQKRILKLVCPRCSGRQTEGIQFLHP